MSPVRALLAATGLVVVLTAAGCGGSDTAVETTTTGTTTTSVPPPTSKTTTVRVYFLRNGQVWPVARAVDTTGGVATATVAELLRGPTAQNTADLKVRTAIPEGAQNAEISIADAVASTSVDAPLPRLALAQLVYTLTQFPTVKSVELGGKRYTRADFEAETPPILVESPVSDAAVSSPLRVRGTANTFEATFNYELRDAAGKILSKHFEMATSGSGTRGTFDFTVPFTVDRDQDGTLTVFELSAEDGSRIHEQEIPIRMMR